MRDCLAVTIHTALSFVLCMLQQITVDDQLATCAKIIIIKNNNQTKQAKPYHVSTLLILFSCRQYY